MVQFFQKINSKVISHCVYIMMMLKQDVLCNRQYVWPALFNWNYNSLNSIPFCSFYFFWKKVVLIVAYCNFYTDSFVYKYYTLYNKSTWIDSILIYFTTLYCSPRPTWRRHSPCSQWDGAGGGAVGVSPRRGRQQRRSVTTRQESGSRALFCGCEWAPSPASEMWTDIRTLLLFHSLLLRVNFSEGQYCFPPVCEALIEYIITSGLSVSDEAV